MFDKIRTFIYEWEEKRLTGYYTGTEAEVVLNTFAEACKMFGYDFEIFRNSENEIIEIAVNKVI